MQCVFEEGAFLHADYSTQKKIIEYLIDTRIYSDACKWNLAAECLCKIVKLANNLPRGRFVSIFVKLSEHIDEFDNSEKEFLLNMNRSTIDILKSNNKKAKVMTINAVKGHCPVILPLFN